jgi:hypothetical protein
VTSRSYYRCTYKSFLEHHHSFSHSHFLPCDASVFEMQDDTEIVVMVDALEHAHIALESDPEVHSMGSIIVNNPLCGACVTALTVRGVMSTDTAFAAYRKLGQIHPGMKPSRF